MPDKQERLQEILAKLSAEKGVQGAILVGRDGIALLNGLKRLPAAETFSAMSATLVAAAETALAELGAKRLKRVVAETEQQRLLAIGVSDDVLLIAILEPSVPLADAIARVEIAAKTLAEQLVA